MSGTFANWYYSADYKSSIDAISRQSLRSIQQAHELRSLVFKYMNYVQNNGTFTNQLALESFSLDSPFRSPKEKNTVKRVSSFEVRRPVLETSVESEKTSSQLPKDGSIYSTYKSFLDGILKNSEMHGHLAISIDSEIMEGISEFIKTYEPSVRTILEELKDLFSDYKDTYEEVEKLKVVYQEALQRKELETYQKKASKNREQEEDNSDHRANNTSNTSDVEQDVSFAEETSDSIVHEDLSEKLDIDFPLQIASAVFTNEHRLARFLSNMISSIPVTKRKIPIPTLRTEYFSSESFCNYLTQHRPHGFQPSRATLEKFGQAFVDLKLIMGLSLMSAKKFRSEGMWFEWTDLAIYVSKYGQDQPDNASTIQSSRKSSQSQLEKQQDEKDDAGMSNSPRSVEKSYLSSTEHNQYVNDLAKNASKRFNGLFKSMKTSLMSAPELPSEVEHEYVEAYLELNNLKHVLDTQIFEKLKFLEKFERLKIKIIYNTFSKLSEVIHNHSIATVHHSHEMVESLKTRDATTIENDFLELIEYFSTGIYFPSNISPQNLMHKRLDTSQSNNAYQNLKLEFNLFKDIAIQPTHRNKDGNELLSLNSIPEFLFTIVNIIGEKHDDKNNMNELWLNPLDHQDYWALKGPIIEFISNFQLTESVDIHNEYDVSISIIDSVRGILSKQSKFTLVNFAKYWLLEIGDSVIPCQVFDSISRSYSKFGDNRSQRTVDLLKYLGSIPRTNLSSLIFIIEHLSQSFELQELPAYGFSDHSDHDLLESPDLEKLKATSNQLNSMETIGAVPFLHLIFRPPSSKASSGYRPPLDMYRLILADLLDVTIRESLFNTLVKMEQSHKLKVEKEKNFLPKVQRQKEEAKIINTTPIRTNSQTTASTSVSDGFTLRPFRTGISPTASPVNSPRQASDGDSAPRSRAGSFNIKIKNPVIQSSNINVEFEK